MEAIYFLVRFTPFWAVPCLLMGSEFAYLFYMRKKMNLVVLCGGIAGFSLIMLAFYWWAGGPERSVLKVMSAKHYYFN